MVDSVRIYLFVFGVLTVAGGVMGFLKANSRPSLIAGGVSGLALIAAGYLAGTANARAGLILGFFVSLALAMRFGRAYAKSKKTMPALPMAVLGSIGVLVTALALGQ